MPIKKERKRKEILKRRKKLVSARLNQELVGDCVAATQSYKEERNGNNNKRQQFRNSWQRTHICFPLNTFIISVAQKREDENSSRQNFQRSVAYFFRNSVTMTGQDVGAQEISILAWVDCCCWKMTFQKRSTPHFSSAVGTQRQTTGFLGNFGVHLYCYITCKPPKGSTWC